MNTEKLRLIVKNLESLVNCLKEEIDSYDNPSQALQYEEVSNYLTDYDEVFYDDYE